MKKAIAILALGALFLSTSICQAQDTTPPTDENVTEYFMDGEAVAGDLIGPDGKLVFIRTKGKSKSLIKVRRHFITQMIKSVEDI